MLSADSLNRKYVKRILVITLSNIGDVILTFPVIDILKRDFPQAELSVVTSAKAASIFNDNPHLKEVILFDKHQSTLKMIQWIGGLRKKHFDFVIDLRNTIIAHLLNPRLRTHLVRKKVKNIHMRQKHLDRLKTVYQYANESSDHYAYHILPKDEEYVDGIIRNEFKETKGKGLMAVAVGAADPRKQWTKQGFADVCDELIKQKDVNVIFVGDEKDRKTGQQIQKLMTQEVCNLCGRTTLTQLGTLLERCEAALVNDSGIMHLCSYLNVPTLALFGPTDPKLYGPWSQKSQVIRRTEDMATIPSEEVLQTMTGHEII